LNLFYVVSKVVKEISLAQTNEKSTGLKMKKVKTVVDYDTWKKISSALVVPSFKV
jgi:hypothetical protein